MHRLRRGCAFEGQLRKVVLGAVPLPKGPSKHGGRLIVLGAINWDTTLFVEQFAAVGEEVRVLKVGEGPGGKGANVAVAAAKVLGKGRVALIGAVGDDDLGPRLRASVVGQGVDGSGIAVVKGAGSGHAYVVVDSDGRKSIHTRFAANEKLDALHVSSALAGREVASSSVVVVMDVPTAPALEAAKAASAGGARVVYSPGSRSSPSELSAESVLGLSHSLVVNEGELLRLAAMNDPVRAIRRFSADFPALAVVVTAGRDGSVVSVAGRMTKLPPFDLGGLNLKAVNSTGSGDAFLAAYSAYTLRGVDPVGAARWGNVAGALKATRVDTRGSPTARQLSRGMALYARST